MSSVFQASVLTSGRYLMKSSLRELRGLNGEDAAGWTTRGLLALFPAGLRDLLIVTYHTYQILHGFTVSCGGKGSCSQDQTQCLSGILLLTQWLNILVAVVALFLTERTICEFVLLSGCLQR